MISFPARVGVPVLFALLAIPLVVRGQQYTFESARWCQGSETFGSDCQVRYDYHTFILSPSALIFSGAGANKEYPLSQELSYSETEEYYEAHLLSSAEVSLRVRVYKQDHEVEGYIYRSELIIRDPSFSNKYFISTDLVR